jgi:peptide/nickel transport system substrate-binding protein
MRRWGRVVVAGVVATAVLAACSSNSSSGSTATSGAATTGGVLKVGTSSGIDSLNPFVAFQQDAYTTFEQIYPMLVQYDVTNLQFAPEFATKWTTSTDGLTWTFTTQPGAKWSDGQPLTAKDAAWTLSTILKYGSGPTANWIGTVAHLKTAVATNDTTLVLTYEEPVSNVLSNLQQIPILPEHVWSQYATGDGKELRTTPNTPQNGQPLVSGGPWELAQYKKDSYAIFQPNPNWYGQKPLIQGWGLQYFSNEDSMIQALQSGSIDYAEGVPTTAVSALKGDKAVQLYEGPGVEFRDFIINSNPQKTTNRELLDPRVREAMEYAIDRNAIVQTAWLGYATPGTTFVPPNTGGPTASTDWHDSSIQALPFDINKANQILDQAGYAKGANGVRMANGHPMSYQVIFPSDESGAGDRAFTIIQNGFKQIGISITQKKMDNSAAFNAIIANNYKTFDLAMWDWVPLIDPDFILSVVTCGQYDSWSDSGYCNKTYDKLYQEQGVAKTPQQRLDLVYQMQKMIYDDRPYIILNYNETIDAWSTKWTGFNEAESVQGWFSPLTKMSLLTVHQA